MATADDIREIFKRVDKQTAMMGEILGEQKAQHRYCEERCKVVDKHEKILYGNGSEGLVPAMASMKTSVDSAAKSQRKSQDKSTRWLRGMVGTMVLAGIGWITDGFGFQGDKAEPDKPPPAVAIDHHDHEKDK